MLNIVDSNISTGAATHLAAALPEKKIIQRGLLVLTVACSAMSLIPPLRFAGSLVTRSVAFLSTSSLCAYSWSKDNNFGLTSYVKLTAVTLGIIGVATSSSLLIVTSLIADLGLQSFNTLKAVYQGEYGKALMHTGVTVINSLALAAVVTGSWPLMVTAAAVSAAAMLAIAIKVSMNAQSSGDAIDVACYSALAVLGAASAVSAAELYSHRATEAHFMMSNNKDCIITLYGSGGRIVGQLNPGETKEIIVPVEHCGNNVFGGPNDSWLGDSLIRTSPVKGLAFGIEADSYTYDSTMIQAALSSAEFPTLPVTGTAIFTEEFA